MQTALKTIEFSKKSGKGMRDGVVCELIGMVKSKILLMLNPNESGDSELCQTVEGAYLPLVAEAPPEMAEMRVQADAITRAGRAVLRAQWQRVKRGD
jgi:hypothetical protein